MTEIFDERERQLLKDCGTIMEKYNNQNKSEYPRNVALFVIFDKSDGIVCSPMIPANFLLQTLYAVTNATNNLSSKIAHGMGDMKDMDAQIGQCSSHGKFVDGIDKMLDEMNASNFKDTANEQYMRFMTMVNKQLGINEPILDLATRDTRELVLESIIKTFMVKESNWRYLVMEGKVNAVIDFLKHMAKDMGKRFPLNIDNAPTDYSYNEISDMITAIEEKSTIFGL